MKQDTCANKISNVLYVKLNIFARSRNRFCEKKTKMLSVCIIELHVTLRNITILSVEKMLLWRIYVTSNNEMDFDFHAKCPILTIFRINFCRNKPKGVGLLLIQLKKELGAPRMSI
jgi:hypothetical protein